MGKRSKACDISEKVKQNVWERDNHCCVVCGETNAMPNAHYISRAKGGLGTERNIVTLCTQFTQNKCHFNFDNGTGKEKEFIKGIIKEYLQSKYKDWNEKDLYYDKWK